MEAARLVAVIEARDQGVAEKFRATDAALDGLGKRVQDTAARAVRLTETISLQTRSLDVQRNSLAQTVARYGESSEAAERKRIAIDKLSASLATNERRLQQTMVQISDLTEGTSRGARGWDAYREIAVGALRQVGELGVEALLSAGRALANVAGEAQAAYISYEALTRQTQGMVAAELRNVDSSLSMAEAMTQASDQAQRLLDWQQQLALNSPFSEQGVAQAFAMAQAYGFVSETASEADVDARRLTNAIVDFVAGSGRSIADAEGIARALGQIQSKGKLSAEEINQLAERGVNLRQILPEALGLTNAEFEKLQRTGQITAEQTIPLVVEALERRFSGAAANAADSYGGLIDKLGELKQIGLREFFEGTAVAIKPALDDITAALSDPAFREGIQAAGVEFGGIVSEVVQGAVVIGGALDQIRRMRDEIAGAIPDGVEGADFSGWQWLENIPGITPLVDSLALLAEARRKDADATQTQAERLEEYARVAGQWTGPTIELAERVEAAVDRVERRSGSTARGQSGGALGGLSGEDTGRRAEAAAAARDHAERMADIVRDGQDKTADAAEAHAGRLADIDRDAARGAEDRARDHADKLADLADDGARRRAEAEAEGRLAIEELDRDAARAREDLARDLEGRLVELASDAAQRRADAEDDIREAALVAEERAAERRADVARDLARRIEDEDRSLALRREDLARDLADKLADIDASAEAKRDDLAAQAGDRRATAADRLRDRLEAAAERSADRRRDLEERLGEATTTAEQEPIRERIAALDREAAETAAKIQAEADREFARLDAQYQREQAALEAKLARERAAAEQAAARRLEDQERDAAREREQAQVAAARKLEDLAATEARERAQREADSARKLADLEADAARAVAAERAAYEGRLAEQQQANERRRADLLADQERKMADLLAEQQRALEAEREAYAQREEEARRSLERRLSDEQASYQERLTALRAALAAERAEEEARVRRDAPTGGIDLTQGAGGIVVAPPAAAATQAGGVNFLAGSIQINGGTVEQQADQLRDYFIRKMRETGGGAFS